MAKYRVSLVVLVVVESHSEDTAIKMAFENGDKLIKGREAIVSGAQHAVKIS